MYRNKINKQKKILKPNSVKELATGILYYNSASILGPLILFIGIGILLDNYLKTKPYLTIIGLIFAFIVSNILILKKIRKLTSELRQYNEEKRDKENEILKNKKEEQNN